MEQQESDAIVRALRLAREERGRLEAGDFEAFAARLDEYGRACGAVAGLPAAQLSGCRDLLLDLVAEDEALEGLLTQMKDGVAKRMSALRTAHRAAEAYFATPGARGRLRRSA